MVEFTVIVGSIGVSLLLLAFFLNLFKILMQDNTIYVEIVGKVPDFYPRISSFWIKLV